MPKVLVFEKIFKKNDLPKTASLEKMFKFGGMSLTNPSLGRYP